MLIASLTKGFGREQNHADIMARNTLKYELNQRALAGDGDHAHKNQLSDLTVKNYKASNAAFADFCKELGIKSYDGLCRYGAKKAIQAFCDHLLQAGKTAQTVHTRLAPICKACDISMAEIEKPKRHSADVKRGRYQVDRAVREENLGRYRPSVQLERAIGIRRSELAHLRGSDLAQTKSGRLYVIVRNGKGGKKQYQRILPQHEATVIAAFSRKGRDEFILEESQISKNINYHGMRADLAKEAYTYYTALSDSQKDALRMFLIEKYQKMANPSEHALNVFKRQINSNTPYLLRGKNLKLALSKGLPIEYDRLALMAVSVEHLSHWRLDVTVNNYMLA